MEAAADAKVNSIDSISTDNLIALVQDLNNRGHIPPLVMKRYEAEWQAWSGKETARYSEMLKSVILSPQDNTKRIHEMTSDSKTNNESTVLEPFDNVLLSCFPKFNESISKETDRGAAIVCAALIEDGLRESLLARFVQRADKEDELLNGSNAPLSSFSAKIDIAYRVGLIGMEIRSSLHLIRKVRNEFAHNSGDISFESESIHDRIRELFRINKGLLDTIWRTVEQKKDTDVEYMVAGYDSQHGVDYLIKLIGWRETFNLLVSLIAARVTAMQKKVEAISPAEWQ